MPVQRVQELTDRIVKERERFVEFVRGVPEESWAGRSPASIWEARDYIAHLASIDPLITAWFRAIQEGRPGQPEQPAFGIDDWNEEQIRARRGGSMDELLDEAAGHREELLVALAGFTDEHLDSTIHFGGDAKRAPRDIPLHLFLTGWSYHDRWHLEDARRALAGEAEQPFGDAAFAQALGRRRTAEA